MTKNTWHFYVYIFLGLAIGIIIKLFIFDILHIKGKSMEPAIRDNSIVFVNKLAYGLVKPGSRFFFTQWSEPKTGDVVIYLYDNKIVVKRCVATGGTNLDFSSNSEYSMTVGEKTISLTKEQFDSFQNCKTVPEGFILALG
ncbi:MAG: signal peptidase I, partial [Treponema sp.]|nr:signal peptidase I [Treponema sp.]